jgi:hypothetical protein
MEVSMCLFASAEHEHLDAHDDLERVGWSEGGDPATGEPG